VTIHTGAAMASAVGLAGSVIAIHGPPARASDSEKIAFLLARDREQQEALQKLSQTIKAAEEDTARQLDELRVEMQGHIAGELVTSEERYRPLRILGTALLAIGLGLTTAGNFV
jgi:hypothetical protein